MQWLYLDNNATTRPLPEVAAAMAEVNEQLWANPSSVHRFGQMVRQRVELARHALAALIGARDNELVMTSGGTEANNLALRGVLARSKADKRVLLTSKLEHAAVREVAEDLAEQGIEVVWLPVDPDGVVHPDALAKALAEHVTADAHALVSLQWANNETGVILPIAQLSQVIVKHRADTKSRVLFHVDGTQAVGKIPVDVKAAGVDMLSFAAHKFHGPKGTGALYVRTGVRLRAQQKGGPQERDRRGGTENTPGIIGAGVAATAAKEFVSDTQAMARGGALRDQLEKLVRRDWPQAVIHGTSDSHTQRLWNTTNIGFPRLEAEAILLSLSEQGLCASAGAACSSGSLEPSPVLLAMGVPEHVAHGSVRFSLSRFTTQEEVEHAAKLIVQVVRRLAQTLPMGV